MKFLTDHSINIQNLTTGEEINTLLNWHLYPATELNMAPPEPKYSYEDTPGSDGSMDSTESVADRVLYENRQGDWEFYAVNSPGQLPNMDETTSWAQIQSDISNFLHGHKCKITFADDPDYYYIGRLQLAQFDPNKYYQHLIISYNVEPYKYKIEEYDSGTQPAYNTLTLIGSEMPAIPTITSTSDSLYFHPEDPLTRGWAVDMIYRLRNVLFNSTATPTITKSKFLDVPEDAPYYTALLWAEENEYVSGITDYIFGGDNVITRAQFATILWRGVGASAYVAGNAPFTDVAKNSYYYNAVKWIAKWNLMAGDGNGHFMPNNPMTRQHACAVMYKMASEPQYSTTASIDDLPGEVTVEAWYVNAVMKLYLENITDGYTDNTYRPGNNITRVQFLTMLWRLAGSPDMSSITVPFTDIGSLSEEQVKAIKYFYAMDWVSGTTSTTFSPERAIYRKEAMQLLFNLGNYYAQIYTDTDLEYLDPTAGDDMIGNGYELPSDVPDTAYYFNAVCWGIMNEITTLDKGYKFNPDNKMTRAMAAQMIFKLGVKLNGWNPDTKYSTDHFTDIRRYVVNYTDAILWAYSVGAINRDMLDHAPIVFTLTNSRGTVTVSVPYGTHEVPGLLIVNGENTLVSRAVGDYEIHYKWGSL